MYSSICVSSTAYRNIVLKQCLQECGPIKTGMNLSAWSDPQNADKWKWMVVVSKHIQARVHQTWCHMPFGALYFTPMKLLLFPDGSAEMSPVWNDGAGEKAAHLLLRWDRFQNAFPSWPQCPTYLITRCYFSRGNAGLSAVCWPLNGFEINPTGCHFSVPLCHLKWGGGRWSPCIYHTASVKIINLTHHLPSPHNHLHLESLIGALSFIPFSFSPSLLSCLSFLQFQNIVFPEWIMALINRIVQSKWKADGFITQINVLTSTTTVAHSDLRKTHMPLQRQTELIRL